MTHKNPLSLLLAVFLAAGVTACGTADKKASGEITLMTLDPGHFHAALLQKQMLPGVSPLAYVYAPLGEGLTAHLNRIARFNHRSENPTTWELEIYAGADSLHRMLRERPGNVVILSGRNRAKIKKIQASIDAGLNVLADKPWIIEAGDLPALEAALRSAKQHNVAAYDAMTLHFEITFLLQRELVNDREIFGTPLKGSTSEPAVTIESMHYLYKQVAGVPNRRPPWFFDIRQQGEGLTDVGTHLVDLVQWTLFPDQAIDYRADIDVTSGKRWPTSISKEQFRQVTGTAPFPDYLKASVTKDHLQYFCNNSVHYTIRGIHTGLRIEWGFEAAPGAGFTQHAIYRGSKTRVEVRHGKKENFKAEVYVVPNSATEKDAVLEALRRKIQLLQPKYPGLAVEDRGEEFRIEIPDALRTGHEFHFALLTSRFLDYVRDPGSMPAWEAPNMLAKYYVTTKGVQLARGR